MAKLFGKLKAENFQGPRLHFWRAKKTLGLPQLPFEHLVIPIEGMGARERAYGRGIAYLRKKTAIGGGFLTIPFSLFEGYLSSAALAGVMIGRHLSQHSGILGQGHYEIGKSIQEHLERGSFPASSAFAYSGKSDYEEIQSSSELAERLKGMTHFAVDNAGNIVLARHPLHEKPNKLTSGEWARALPHLVLWHQVFQRYRGKLQKPKRIVRQEAPKISLAAKLAAAKPAFQGNLFAKSRPSQARRL